MATAPSRKEITLPSGAVLSVAPAPFADAKRLYQALLTELRGVPFTLKNDSEAFIKDLACAGFSSPLVDTALEPCLARCIYNKLKIEANTFESPESRQDYIPTVVEVVKENVVPFLKSLFAVYDSQLRTAVESRK